MENQITMKDLKLVYDRENNEFVKAFVTINEEKYTVNGNDDVWDIINEFVSERNAIDENVKRLQDIPEQYSLVYTTNTKVIALFEEKYKDAELLEEPLSFILEKNNEYNGKETHGLMSLKNAIIIGGVSIGVGALGLIGCNHFKSQAEKTAVVQEVKSKDVKNANPRSWKQYVDEYVESNQKQFLTSNMQEIKDELVEINVNDKVYKLTLTPEDIIALDYYYNTFEMSNEEMLSIYGSYNNDSGDNKDLINNVHSALDKIRISIVKAEKIEDVIMPEFTDEVTQELFTKYAKLFVEFNNSKSKSSIKSDFEDMFRADFIENGSVDLNEHPSASVILQVFPSAFNLSNSPLNKKLNVILVGQETNIGVEGVKDTVEQNGLVDDACSVIDRRLEKFDDFRNELERDHTIISKDNKDLLLDVNADLKDDKDQAYYEERYVESEYATLTKDTYDLDDVMIPLMNDELSLDLGSIDISFEDINDEIMKDMISELQQQQLNNTKPWNLKTNPSGGKKGDTIKGETVRQEVTGTQISQQQVTASKEEYKQKNPDIVDGTNKEEVKQKEEQMKEDLGPICKQAYEAGQNETINGGPNAALNSTYANHKEQVVRDYYFDGRNNGIAVWNDVQAAKNNQVVETPSNEPTHKDNPNQNGGNNEVQDTPVVEEKETEQLEQPEQSVKPEESVQPEQQPSQPENNIPDHSSNPNQNGNNQNDGEDEVIIENVDTSNTIYNMDTTHVIDGTITSDPTDVEDMSQYGEVQDVAVMSISSDEFEQQLDSYIEMLADPNSEINQEVESTYELTK